jgi:hypothetical protein
MIIGEVDRRETADAVKRFCLELRGCCGEPSSTERGRTRPLKWRPWKLPKCEESPNGLSVSEMRGGALFLERVGRLYKNVEDDARAKARCPVDLAAWCRCESSGWWERRPETGCGNDAELLRQRPPFSAAFPMDTKLQLVGLGYDWHPTSSFETRSFGFPATYALLGSKSAPHKATASGVCRMRSFRDTGAYPTLEHPHLTVNLKRVEVLPLFLTSRSS